MRFMRGDRKQVWFCEMTGDLPQNVSRYMNTVTPSVDFLAALAKNANISLDWLVLGRGKMEFGEIDLSGVPYDVLQIEASRQRLQLEQNLMRLQKEFPSGETLTMEAFAQRGVKAGLFKASPETKALLAEPIVIDAESVPADWRGHYVPIIGKIAAGKGFDTLEAESYPAGIAATYLKAEGVPMSAVAVQIAGDSMEPEYHHGQIVIVDCKRRATRGVCCVLERMETGERMARIKKLVIRGLQATLVSLNPKYEPLPVPLENIEAFALWKG